MIDVEVVKPITIYRINGRVTGACHNGFEADPSSHDTLGSRIEGSWLAHNHRRKDGLCMLLNMAHPAPVTVYAHTFCDEVHGVAALPCLFARTGTPNHSILARESPRVLDQETRHPLREDMLSGGWCVAAEDATSGHYWCTFSHERHTVESAETQEPKGLRDFRARMRGLPSRSQGGGEGEGLNPAQPKEVASQTAPALTGAHCTKGIVANPFRIR